jgi:thiamine biosynthesis lipoprotein
MFLAKPRSSQPVSAFVTAPLPFLGLLVLGAALACSGESTSGEPKGVDSKREETKSAAKGEAALERHTYTRTQMGVPFRLVIFAADADEAQAASEAAFARVTALNAIFSDYDPQSEAMRLSAKSGDEQFHDISMEMRTVLVMARQYWMSSDGAFDVTVGPLTKIWRQARSSKKLPQTDALQAARSSTGMDQVTLTPVALKARLEAPQMRLDFGGLVKGFALDEALHVLSMKGIRHALAAAGGDIATLGAPPGEPGWRIGLTPLDADAEPSAFLLLRDRAVASSGDAYQFVEIEGKRYSHIVDPRTGFGLTTRSSVTVVANRAVNADAAATTASVLGPEKGMRWIETQSGLAARFVYVPETGREPRETTSRLWDRLEIVH